MGDKREHSDEVGLQPGSKIGKYEVVERLGMGGQAIVYKCRDPLLDRFVAVKQVSSHLAADPEFLTRFREEAKTLAKLGAEQPAIVTIYELVEDERGLFIVMEYVEGRTLEAVLAESGGPVEPGAVLRLLWRLAAALHSVHAAGIIHRDIKPANIIVTEGLHAKLMDFGVAASRADQASMRMGTTKYMAPELFEGQAVDARADIYSLGFITYEMLLGREKFNEIFADVVRDPQSEVLRWMKWHGNMSVHAPPAHEVNPGVPVSLSEIVAGMTAKNVDERFESMEQLGRTIKQSFSSRTREGAASPAAAKVATGQQASPAPPTERPDRGDAGGAERADAASAANDTDAAAHTAPDEGEGPATAPIPRKKLTRRKKLILAGAIGGLVLIASVTALVFQQIRAAERRRQVQSLFETAKAQYDEALPPHDRQEFAKAIDGLEQVINRSPPSHWAARARVLLRLSEAYTAVLDGQWDRAVSKQQQAEKAVSTIQREWSDDDWPEELQEWVRTKRDEIDSLESHRIESRKFATLLALGQAILAAGDELDAARAAIGEGAPDNPVDLVVRTQQTLISKARDAYPEGRWPDLVDKADEALEWAKKNLRELSPTAPPARRQDILVLARDDVVFQATEMLDLLKPPPPGTEQAAGEFSDSVRKAREDVQEALAGKQQRERQQRRDELKSQLDGMFQTAQRHLARAVERANAGNIDAAREQDIEKAKRLREDVHDWVVPREAASMLGPEYTRELKTYRDETFDKLGAAIVRAETDVKQAAANMQKTQALADATKAARVAENEGDWVAARNWLDKAVSLAGQVAPEQVDALKQRLRRATLRARVEKAAELKAKGNNVRALSILESVLAQDPPEDIARMARAAKGEVEGNIAWAGLVDEGESLAKAKKWSEALEKFRQAAEIREDRFVSERIAECRYRVGRAEAEQLVDAGKLAEALAKYEQLKEMRPSAQDYLDRRIAGVRRQLQFKRLLTKGQQALQQREWYDARMAFQEAAELYPEDSKRAAEARRGLEQAIYYEWLEKGQKRLAAEDFVSARAYFRNARRHAVTDVQKQRADELIAEAERGMQDQE
ncbi:MAG: protein kinase [Phycisphaerae bacterium]|nr:protein kinase [Phycisphaerae bacterium]